MEKLHKCIICTIMHLLLSHEGYLPRRNEPLGNPPIFERYKSKKKGKLQALAETVNDSVCSSLNSDSLSSTSDSGKRVAPDLGWSDRLRLGGHDEKVWQNWGTEKHQLLFEFLHSDPFTTHTFLRRTQKSSIQQYQRTHGLLISSKNSFA